MVGAGDWEECEWVRRAWLWESIRARESMKERNVRGAMKSCFSMSAAFVA